MSNNSLRLSLTILLSVAIVFNQWQLNQIHSHPNLSLADQAVEQSVSIATDNTVSEKAKLLAAQLIPKGIPKVYGAELGVSFDQAANSIGILAQYEQDTRPDKLSGEKLERYIKIGMATSCEFCCSARTMVFPDGKKACACAHSAAMRGLAAYLLDNYGDNMSDQEILAEVNQWKVAYFPGPTVQKTLASSSSDVVNSGLQQQVGGC